MVVVVVLVVDLGCGGYGGCVGRVSCGGRGNRGRGCGCFSSSGGSSSW